MIKILILSTLISTTPDVSQLSAQRCFASSVLLSQPSEEVMFFKGKMMSDIVSSYPDKDVLELTGYFLGVELTRLTMEINYGTLNLDAVKKDYLNHCNWNV